MKTVNNKKQAGKTTKHTLRQSTAQPFQNVAKKQPKDGLIILLRFFEKEFNQKKAKTKEGFHNGTPSP